MKKCMLSLALFAAASCIYETAYYFTFCNHSDYDITVIVDLDTGDSAPSPGSQCTHVENNSTGYVSANDPWSKIIKDSIYIYLVNKDMVDIPSYRLLSEYDASRITQEMILERFTVHHSDVIDGDFKITFPLNH